MTTIKIASWNINSVRARAELVERLLTDEQPDVLCLQETKAINEVFPADLFRKHGYVHQQLNGQKMHHGVAIVSRLELYEPGSHDWQDNGEARHVGVRLPGGMRLENVYVPAGGDIPDRSVNPKFGQKLDFIGRMTRWSEKLREPTLVVGDFNVAPLECDVWSHKALVNVVSHTPIEIDALDQLLNMQSYRLAHWRVASEEINYRRFFDVNELAALRMEDPAVFDEVHRFAFELVQKGAVTGLRIDHVDGLFAPGDYLRRLQERCGERMVAELRRADRSRSIAQG